MTRCFLSFSFSLSLTVPNGLIHCIAFRFDGQVDAWFLGMLLYQMLNGGHIPFVGNDDEQIRRSILQGGDTKFSLLRNKIDAVRSHTRNGSVNEEDDKELKLWMDISDSLFDLVTGLLAKDSRERYTVDEVLWSEWIPKSNHSFITRAIVRHWLHRYRIPDQQDAVLTLCSNFAKAVWTLTALHQNNTFTPFHSLKHLV